MSLDPEGDHRRKTANDLFMLGRALVKNGDRERAHRLLQQAVEKDPDHDLAWLWLSATSDDPAEQKHCLEWAVAANPANVQARRALAILTGKLDPKDIVVPAGLPAQTPAVNEPASAEVRRTFACPRCGGRLRFDPELVDLRCENCGFVDEVVEKPLGARDQVLDFTLPTRAGHRWAEAERLMTCQQCAAKTVFPPGQTSLVCPFCGHGAFVTSPEDAGLIAPHGLIPMGLEAHQVQAAVRQWLGAGFFAPDDLRVEALGRLLRPAYVPFWVFNATQTAHWRAMVHQGYGREARWVWTEGEHTLFHTDHLEPGLRALPPALCAQIAPFDLTKLVEYKPEYLAGWPAATYDLSLAQASQNAHAAMTAEAKRQLRTKAASGQEKREFEIRRSEFTGETYKLVLLPVWTGAYHYRRREYRVLVNGQTHRVAGDKPMDWVKVVLVALAAAGVIALAIAIGLLFWQG